MTEQEAIRNFLSIVDATIGPMITFAKDCPPIRLLRESIEHSASPLAPWLDFHDQPIRHGDRLVHPDGTTFVAVRLNGYADEGDAWRVVYDSDLQHVSRLCLQIGDKGRAVLTIQPAAAPAQAATDEALPVIDVWVDPNTMQRSLLDHGTPLAPSDKREFVGSLVWSSDPRDAPLNPENVKLRVPAIAAPETGQRELGEVITYAIGAYKKGMPVEKIFTLTPTDANGYMGAYIAKAIEHHRPATAPEPFGYLIDIDGMSEQFVKAHELAPEHGMRAKSVTELYTAAPAQAGEPVLFAALNMNGRVVYQHESRENVEMNQHYIKTPTTLAGLVAVPVAQKASTGGVSDE